ncbi:MltF family protein [Williamwhitmania taraxaci]|uniref:Membrane-bound lytic murein transglycosylase F n=1 Tax=Williamwhitmania taraxaci TaxID=1640674 RepID=A0A1G6RV07_9BACT|nr:transglycosylase SLT domain-containing protein [Williamwhitmania taraxaci]SDD08281.1 membrane-bound lytic murein transglycosylase F [Williamwhitmania taraxaci]
MILFYSKRTFFIFSLFLVGLLFSCNNFEISSVNPNSNLNISAIKERGKLVAATDNSGISFFVHKGHPMGFQFELLKELARTIGVPLEIIPVKSFDEAYSLLDEGLCDIVAMNLVPTKALANKISYTIPHSEVKLALVSLGNDSSNLAFNRSILGKRRIDLQGRGISITNGSSKSADELVEMVALGDIDQAIVEYSDAMVGELRFPRVKVLPLTNLTEQSCWAVNKRSPLLLQEVNSWLSRYKSTANYAYILSKYNSDDLYLRYASAFITPGRNAISKYDGYFKHYSNQKGLDWKLVASIVYQESRFNADVISQSGAYGLMQIMPITAEHFGVDDISTPQKNIKVGVMLLNYLRDYYVNAGISEEEATKFVLGAYNGGLGHIEDARRLAEKYHSNPNSWEDVAFFLRMKSQPKYYKDPIVKCGKFSGSETSRFVTEVLERYGYYSSLVTI